MKVAFQLRRRAEVAPVTALLLPSHRAADLLDLLERVTADPLPRIHCVADGFLLKLPRPTEAAVPGAIRLRALAGDLLLPADADLIPPLLEDEAAALVRTRGLIFLPGGRVLEYAPAQPVSLAALLAPPALDRRDWAPLPEVPPLPESLSEITLDLPFATPEAVLEASGGDIGTEAPLPPESGAPARVAGGVAFGVGRGLAWLGQALGLPGLARAGARLMGGALSLAPRLSAALLGRQAASLRELLRMFRAGDIERALRRAVAIGGDGRGDAPASGSRLPWHSGRYSLGDLLRPDEPGALWLGGFNVWQELEKEYRRQAEQAARAGDYRRAAFIYGKLLGDFRAAAVVLAQAGLHRDAAILYEKKLHDLHAAAREYEAAGEIDRAVELYRQRGLHVEAGDLLRRAGEEELAIAEYRLAARKMVEANAMAQYEAGELLLTKTARTDLALPYYQEGWTGRPNSAFMPCALRLAQLHAQAGTADRLWELIAEADRFFGPPGNDVGAAEFYHEVARLADREELAGVRDDLRDRALVGVAGKLRQQTEANARPGPLVQTLMGPRSPWAPPVVSDARFAVQQASRRRITAAAAAFSTTSLRARVPCVTAVCRAPETGLLFVGFESGEVFCFHPLRGEVSLVTDAFASVRSLATDCQGKTVVVLCRDAASGTVLLSYASHPDYRLVSSQVVNAEGEAWLCPLLAPVGREIVVLWDGAALRFLRSPSLVPIASREYEDKAEQPDPLAPMYGGSRPARLEAALLHLAPLRHAELPGVLLMGGNRIEHLPLDGPHLMSRFKTIRWSPGLPAGSPLSHPHLAWVPRSPNGMEVAGIDSSGLLCWSYLMFTTDDTFDNVTSAFRCGPETYHAVALLAPGLVAGVTTTAVQWLRREGQGFRLLAETRVALSGAVACFHHHAGNEVIVVSRNGTLTRVPRTTA